MSFDIEGTITLNFVGFVRYLEKKEMLKIKEDTEDKELIKLFNEYALEKKNEIR